MEPVGINLGYLLVQLFNLLFFIGWPVLSFFTLYKMRARELADLVAVLWTALILLIPFIGAIAFWLVKPGKPRTETEG